MSELSFRAFMLISFGEQLMLSRGASYIETARILLCPLAHFEHERDSSKRQRLSLLVWRYDAASHETGCTIGMAKAAIH